MAVRVLVIRGLALIPSGLLRKIETGAGLALGKGAADVNQEVRSCLRLLGTTKGRSIRAVDLGANEGKWAAELLRAEPSAFVTCIEAQMELVSMLQRRFRSEHGVTVIQAVVAGDMNARTFSIPIGKPSHGRLDAVDSKAVVDGLTRDVSTITLDRLFSNAETESIDILKMDIEGSEWEALQVAVQTLSRVKVLQFEFGDNAIDRRVFFRDFWELLTDYGFEIWRQTPRRLLRIPEYDPRLEMFACTNYFARRRDH